MVEQWGLEILYAFGRMFYNPLLYWAFLLLLIAGARRVKRERSQFGVKVFQQFSEIKRTFLFSLLFGVLISIISVLFGFVFSYEIIIVLVIATILLSISGSFHLLSATYTLGITFIILMLLPLLPDEIVEQMSLFERLENIEFVTLAILVSIFLFVESLLIYFAKNDHVYPALQLSERGIWLGEQQLKRMAIVPFLIFLPTNGGTNLAPILPFIQFGDVTYHLTIIPFVIGVQFTARTEYMFTLKRTIMKQKLLLSIIVLLLSIASYFYFILSIVAIIIAIIGNEWITYRNKMRNQYRKPVFAPLDEGVKVLATVPGSRAEQLEILPGEIITKVNGITVSNSDEFYKALQKSGAFFKLDVIDVNNEVRFLQSAFYAEDHHDLGILLPEVPYKERRKQRVNQLHVL